MYQESTYGLIVSQKFNYQSYYNLVCGVDILCETVVQLHGHPSQQLKLNPSVHCSSTIYWDVVQLALALRQAHHVLGRQDMVSYGINNQVPCVMYVYCHITAHV